jgi:UDP-N-acetylglucosamine:LPS N-acetylglucosamine transferase
LTSSLGMRSRRLPDALSPPLRSPRRAPVRRRILLVCSSGGHLTQLLALRPWWEEHERLWVTFQKPDSQSVLRGERVVWAYHPTTRNVLNLIRNLLLSWRVLLRYRPHVVVSTGAGVAFPFFLVAKALGSRTVYVEVYDRIQSATLTGRLCYPLSNLFLLQWEEQKSVYPGGIVIGPLL